MNQHNISKTPDLPVKRKRGRPRKDESMPRNVRQQTQPPLVMMAPTSPPGFLTTIHPPPPTPSAVITTIQPQPPPPATATTAITSSINANKPATAATVIASSSNVNKIDPNMVGQAVTCVIDGIFDNGYLLSTRLGSNNTILRGIVFQQGRVVPVTPANDVAPNIEMCTRGEFPIPPSNPTRSSMQVSIPELVCPKQLPIQPVATQNTPGIVAGGSSSSAPQESLRLVELEQDDVMQVFEVSKTVEEPLSCDQSAKNEQMVSDDPTAESFPKSDTIIQGLQSLDKANENESIFNTAPNDQQHAKEDVEGNPELITPVDTIVDNQSSMANDGLQQDMQDQTGEESNNAANQDPDQEVAVDLSLNNFPTKLTDTLNG